MTTASLFDPTMVRQWLELLHGQAPGLTHICSTGDWSGRVFSETEAAARYVSYLDGEGRHGIYARITTLKAALLPGSRGGAADTLALPALWADVDIAGAGHIEPGLPPDEPSARAMVALSGLPQPSRWVHSGGGLYPIWLLDTPYILDDDETTRHVIKHLSAEWQKILTAAGARFGWKYGSGVGDLARVLRIPGTVNRKVDGAPQPCRLLDDDGHRYTLVQLRAGLATAAAAIAPPVPTSTPPTIHTSLIRSPGPRTCADPGEDFNERGDWITDVMGPRGWREHYRQDGTIYLTRPGKDTGTSASINALGTNRLHVFTTNAPPLQADESYHKFAAFTILNFGDNSAESFRAATRALADRGYGQPIDHGARQAELLAGILGPDQASVALPAGLLGAGEPKTPRGGPPSAYFKDSSLLVETLATTILATHPCALTSEQRVAIYTNGVYQPNVLALTAAITRLLGDRFQPKHRAAVTEFIAATLYDAGQLLPDRSISPLLNVANGMLNLATGLLLPHDPAYLSSIQLPVTWNPDATCPRYEDWITDVIPDQVEDIEETIAAMLDPSRTPTRALFAFGPSRSGKSTFLRIAAAIAGAANTSAVTLHQLVDDRFSSANLYGKILNSAADISSGHVEDIGIFKMMTGEDPINANRKYGGQFTFTNRALFAFSANTLPTVGESSRAYVERIKPFAFETSFAGHEDPSIEVAIMSELPGILTRWVHAHQRLRARGHRLATPDKIRQEFEERSDRVRQWVADCCEISGGTATTPGAILPGTDVSSKRWLARKFNAWAKEQGSPVMGERKIIDRLTSIDGIVEVRSSFDKSRGLNLRVVIQDAEVDDLLGGRSSSFN